MLFGGEGGKTCTHRSALSMMVRGHERAERRARPQRLTDQSRVPSDQSSRVSPQDG
jgi:hypothetical protein